VAGFLVQRPVKVLDCQPPEGRSVSGDGGSSRGGGGGGGGGRGGSSSGSRNSYSW
jgi:hypothetical protein